MKQKKGNTSMNAAKNDSSLKTPKNSVPKTPGKSTPAKVNQSPKKMAKTPVKVVPPKEVEEEEDDESEDEDSGADVAAGVAGEVDGSDMEDNDDEDDDDEDDDENDDEDEEDVEMEAPDNEAEDDESGDDNEGDEEDEEQDDEPVEEPIAKKAAEVVTKEKKAKKGNAIGVPNIKTGALPKDFPKDQVLVVKNLPKTYKQIDVVEVFAKFGTLHTIYNNHGPVSSVAYVAYTSAEEAEAAQQATNNVAKVKGATLKVSIQGENPKKAKKAEKKKKTPEEQQAFMDEKKNKMLESRPRTVYVKNLKFTSEDQLKEHFNECGEIDNLRVFSRPKNSYGFITFKQESSVPAALNLHNSILNGQNIWVVKCTESVREGNKDPQRTLIVKNTKEIGCIEQEKLESIFSKCGELESIIILCSKRVIAFVTFKDSVSAKKALKLQGTTVQGLDIELEEYNPDTNRSKNTIFIQNVKTGITDDHIRELFGSTGPIESISLKNGYAIVKFEDTDGFCKSFALNESVVCGHMLFIEPYSEKKQFVLRKNQPKSLDRKRKAPFNNSSYGKKMKN